MTDRPVALPVAALDVKSRIWFFTTVVFCAAALALAVWLSALTAQSAQLEGVRAGLRMDTSQAAPALSLADEKSELEGLKAFLAMAPAEAVQQRRPLTKAERRAINSRILIKNPDYEPYARRRVRRSVLRMRADLLNTLQLPREKLELVKDAILASADQHGADRRIQAILSEKEFAEYQTVKVWLSTPPELKFIDLHLAAAGVAPLTPEQRRQLIQLNSEVWQQRYSTPGRIDGAAVNQKLLEGATRFLSAEQQAALADWYARP